MSFQQAKLGCEEILRSKVKSKQPMLRLSTHPNDTINVQGIRAILRNWERQGWEPDVVICDYADVLAAPTGVTEPREQINKTWKQLRALSQSLHCLVVTATQADASSYDKPTLTRKNFSDDKRKLSHVTGMVGINSTHDERLSGIRRLNWIVIRDSDLLEGTMVHVAGCVAFCHPTMKSCWPSYDIESGEKADA
jgi:hypothetical protein